MICLIGRTSRKWRLEEDVLFYLSLFYVLLVLLLLFAFPSWNAQLYTQRTHTFGDDSSLSDFPPRLHASTCGIWEQKRECNNQPSMNFPSLEQWPLEGSEKIWMRASGFPFRSVFDPHTENSDFSFYRLQEGFNGRSLKVSINVLFSEGTRRVPLIVNGPNLDFQTAPFSACVQYSSVRSTNSPLSVSCVSARSTPGGREICYLQQRTRTNSCQRFFRVAFYVPKSSLNVSTLLLLSYTALR